MTKTDKQALRQTAEKAQEHAVFNMDIHSGTVLELLDEMDKWQQESSTWQSVAEKQLAIAIEAEKRIAELEARTLTVKLPEYRNSPDMHTKQYYEAVGFNQGLDACAEAIGAAGIALDTGE
ncbi:hypothetical protein ACQVA2_07930 [Citrobacter sp. OP27]